MNEAEKILTAKFGKVKKAGKGYVRITCPTCTPHNAKKMKRYVHTESLYTRCWICETALTFQELTGSNVLPQATAGVKEERVIDPRAIELPCDKLIPLNELPPEHPALKFLAKDHLTEFERYSKEYGIGYCPVGHGKILCKFPMVTSNERIIFPVVFKGKQVGWQMRSIPGTFYGDRTDVIKYYHLYDKGSYLYNYDKAKEHKMVIVVEGIKKALKFPNGVATLGKGISDTQIQLLQEWPRITIMLDSDTKDPKTQEKAEELTKALNLGPSQVININLAKYGYESPDEATAEELSKIVYIEWNKK